jgi:formate C-acetyltransferase
MEAFVGLLKTYFSKGGFAMHGNVFNADDLRAAQKDPERYATLQVRVCGWNAYFTKLSKAEQESFICQTETSFM